MKRILVTGAAGFLGSHLTKELLQRGHHLTGIDNLSSGKMEHINELLGSDRFRFIEYDVSDPGVLQLPGLSEVEEIYHMASPASPKFYQAAPFETIAANTIGTKNMLELARLNRSAMVFCSTSEAYGDPEISPQTEEYRGNVNTWGPRGCYDEAKRLGEVFCYEYWCRYQTRVKVARIFNTYSAGLRNDDGRVISNFVTQALSGSDITVYGDGSQKRSFCYVDDTVSALILMMETDQATGRIINIGNPEERTVLELAWLVQQMTETDSPITFHPLPQDDPKHRRPSIEKAKTLLGWEPAVSLEEGLRRTIHGYRSRGADRP
ncbi:NAD-dependent epimerase/dehydratase family protein [Paenibacillus humicola]|uniref:NAD-dependent epimerase/dehydratase family protein n=1 Tax=Paenibacillus humicola TaxID=3110540 RepID=UPI00237C43A7|nr:NAD-dependent epimerase/dehydratase family protein [Paenibacillus humicola]